MSDSAVIVTSIRTEDEIDADLFILAAQKAANYSHWQSCSSGSVGYISEKAKQSLRDLREDLVKTVAELKSRFRRD